MNESFGALVSMIPVLVMVMLAGMALGAGYFAGLRLTVGRMASSSNPYGIIILSFFVRSAALLAGLWLLTEGDWLRLSMALLGFLAVRTALAKIWGPIPSKESA